MDYGYSNSGNELWMLAEVSQRRTSVTWWRCYAVCFDIEERADETAGITLSTSQQAEHQELPYHHREGVSVGDLATLSLQHIVWSCHWEGADKVVKVAGDTTCNLLAVTRPHLDLQRFRKLQSLCFLQIRLLPLVETFPLLVKVLLYLVMVVVRVLVI